MNIKQNLVSLLKYAIKCPYSMTPKYITIHNTANDASAANEIKYMISNNNKVSFHVAVDDKECIQGIPFNRNAWHAGDGGTGTGNRQSIGIEICYSKSGGERFDKAYKNAIEVTAQLMKQFNIPVNNVVYHQHWSGKNCPHRLIAAGVNIIKYRDLVTAKYNELYGNKNNSYLVKINDEIPVCQISTTVKKGEVFTIVEEKKIGQTVWGKLKSGAGWICLNYCTRI